MSISKNEMVTCSMCKNVWKQCIDENIVGLERKQILVLFFIIHIGVFAVSLDFPMKKLEKCVFSGIIVQINRVQSTAF